MRQARQLEMKDKTLSLLSMTEPVDLMCLSIWFWIVKEKSYFDVIGDEFDGEQDGLVEGGDKD